MLFIFSLLNALIDILSIFSFGNTLFTHAHNTQRAHYCSMNELTGSVVLSFSSQNDLFTARGSPHISVLPLYPSILFLLWVFTSRFPGPRFHMLVSRSWTLQQLFINYGCGRSVGHAESACNCSYKLFCFIFYYVCFQGKHSPCSIGEWVHSIHLKVFLSFFISFRGFSDVRVWILIRLLQIRRVKVNVSDTQTNTCKPTHRVVQGTHKRAGESVTARDIALDKDWVTAYERQGNTQKRGRKAQAQKCELRTVSGQSVW